MIWVPMASASTFMPPAASKVASQVDSLYAFMLIASVISFIILIGGMCYFIYKYRRKSANDKTPYISHNHTLEFIWSFIPFVIFMVCFGWGAKVYLEMRDFQEDSVEIHVYGKKWAWEFEYKNGRKITDDIDDKGGKIPATLVAPLGKPVKLLMTSVKLSPQDKAVLHSFFIPSFRVKQDVIPGRYTALTFTANKKGLFQVFCTEYCGTGHSSMLARVKVVSPEEFDNWVLGEDGSGAGAPGEESMADKGKKVYLTKTCNGCHSLDGSKSVGPTWKGLYGSTRTFADGSTAQADENYIRESIWEPNKRVSQGFQAGQMPTFKGMVSEEEINYVIEFMKTLK